MGLVHSRARVIRRRARVVRSRCPREPHVKMAISARRERPARVELAEAESRCRVPALTHVRFRLPVTRPVAALPRTRRTERAARMASYAPMGISVSLEPAKRALLRFALRSMPVISREFVIQTQGCAVLSGRPMARVAMTTICAPMTTHAPTAFVRARRSPATPPVCSTRPVIRVRVAA